MGFLLDMAKIEEALDEMAVTITKRDATISELRNLLRKARNYMGKVRTSDIEGDDPIFGVMDEIDAALLEQANA